MPPKKLTIEQWLEHCKKHKGSCGSMNDFSQLTDFDCAECPFGDNNSKGYADPGKECSEAGWDGHKGSKMLYKKYMNLYNNLKFVESL